MMVRYFSAWTPLVIVATVVLLSLPWLGLIALVMLPLVGLVALAALAWAVVFVPYTLGRAISRRWHGSVASPRTMAALPATNTDVRRTRSAKASGTVLRANHLPRRGI